MFFIHIFVPINSFDENDFIKKGGEHGLCETLATMPMRNGANSRQPALPGLLEL
jgi:hypothetical protein